MRRALPGVHLELQVFAANGARPVESRCIPIVLLFSRARPLMPLRDDMGLL